MAEPVFFESLAEWRAWLAKHHAERGEISIGFRKRATGVPGITYKEAVDGALAYGWIDGVRHRIDDANYRIRFTPRKRGSIWSAVNLKRAAELREAGAMTPAGLAAFEGRDPRKAGRYSFEQGELSLPPAYAGRLAADPAAAGFFASQPRTYVRAAIWWVIQASQAATQERRLARLIADSAAGRRLKHLVSPGKGV